MDKGEQANRLPECDGWKLEQHGTEPIPQPHDREPDQERENDQDDEHEKRTDDELIH